MEFRAIVFLTAMLIFCRIKNSKSIVNDKWINSGNSQIVFSSLALNWNDASLHCHRYGAGLLHRNNFTDIPLDFFDGPNKSIWIGLKWVNDRLQWMSQKPQEESDLEEITKYADLRVNSSSPCYSLSRGMKIAAEHCGTKLRYVCALPSIEAVPRSATITPFSFAPSNPDIISEPVIIFSNGLTTNNPPYAMKSSSNSGDKFTVECQVQKNASCNNGPFQFRWLVNGGYKPLNHNQNNISITDLVYDSFLKKNSSPFKFFGKMSCEILCPSSGTTHHSKQRIILSDNTVSLRIEFGFNTLNLTLMMLYFDSFLKDTIATRALGRNERLVRDEVPFLSRVDENNKQTFSFYAHFEELAEDDIKRLTTFLMDQEGSGFWLPPDWLAEELRLNETTFHLFGFIEVYVLNYCVKSNGNRTNIAFAHRLRKRHEEEAYDITSGPISGCSLASYQCVADWFRPAKWQFSSTSKECTRCMARFEEFQGRCLRTLDSKPFYHSAASCLSGYRKLDHREISWSFSEWVRLFLMWINEHDPKQKLYWFPMRRGIAMGPLFPVWPWEFEEYKNVTKISMDHLLKVMKVDSLSWNASELDPSLDCLAFDVRNKSLKSVPCYWELPMVCIRPELISPNKLTDTLEKRTGTFQCPTNSWHTSLLFPDKDVCYKVFTSSASSVLYKDAILSCESQGGHLAIAHDSSTLQAIQNLLGTLIRDPPNRLWIGLRKVNTQEPIMLPIQPTVGQTAASNWKVWSQIDQPNGYICEKMTTRQQDTELYIDNTGEFGLLSVGVDFKPLTSNKDRTNVSELLERSSENRIKPATKVNFQLSCFVGRDYAYQKSIQIGKSELKLPFLQISERTESYEWLGPEIRCETWDSWTPEPLRKSWIFPGDSAARPTSFVIRFRHLNVTYVSTSHDPTFVHRSELYKSTLNYFKKLFHEEFVKKYETNLSMLLEPGTDPLVFQQDNEDLTSSNLISSYRLVILVSPEVHSNVEEQAFIDLNSFLTAKFKDSNNRSDVGVVWVDIKATEFCPSHGTSDRGEFVKFITDSERLLEDPLNERPNIIIWPKARAGELITSEYPCVDSHGNLIERRCLGNRITGLFWESLEEKKTSDSTVLCSTIPSSRLKRLFDLRVQNGSGILQSVNNELQNANELSVPELRAVSCNLESATKDEIRTSCNDMGHLESIIQKILQEKTLSEAQRNSGFSSKVAHSVEHLLTTCVDNPALTSESTLGAVVELIKRPFMVASTVVPNEGGNTVLGFSAEIEQGNITRSNFLLSNTTYHEEVKRSDVTILLASGAVPYDPEVKVLFAVHPDTRLIDASAADGSFSSLIYEQNSDFLDAWFNTEKLYTGNGGMAEVKVSSNQAVMRANPVTVLFRPRRRLTADILPSLRCVFWESRANFGKGGWSAEGCWMDGTLNGLVVCRCNHLSTFTLLVSRAEVDLRNTVHGTVLSIFTVIGALLSILGLSFIVTTFILVRSWRKPIGHRIVFQLSLALILLLVTFIGGVNNVSYPMACRVAGVVLHYFLLVAFAWMTVEAYVQYLFLVRVFDTYVPRLVLKASLIAWGAPIVPIAIVLTIDKGLYNGDEGYCWIDKSAFYPAVVAPLSLLVVINVIVFILIIRSLIVTGRSAMRSTLATDKRNTQKAFAAVFNCFLLGLTWTFGFLAVGPVTSVIFSYFFCLTTVLQGFFIFLFYVVRDSSLRIEWIDWFGKIIPRKEKEFTSSGHTAFYSQAGNTSA